MITITERRYVITKHPKRSNRVKERCGKTCGTVQHEAQQEDAPSSDDQASSETDLQCSLERFAAEYDMTGMQVDASKMKSLILSRSSERKINGEAVEQLEKIKNL
ncbi:unnamed protein product [Soboliphyme baturini]|uniref:Uncharacterized protein n=1 Tax=Soboliphyme baturini TaxID=241478 RepID=A0A183J5I6_9BILA|nr:unnamed protein product [Soboliphyme baturini]